MVKRPYSNKDLQSILSVAMRRGGLDGTYSRDEVLKAAEEIGLEKGLVERVLADYSNDRLSEEERIAVMTKGERTLAAVKRGMKAAGSTLAYVPKKVGEGMSWCFEDGPNFLLSAMVGGLIALSGAIGYAIYQSPSLDRCKEEIANIYAHEPDEGKREAGFRYYFTEALEAAGDRHILDEIVQSSSSQMYYALKETGFQVYDGIDLLAVLDRYTHSDSRELADAGSAYVRALKKNDKTMAEGLLFLDTAYRGLKDNRDGHAPLSDLVNSAIAAMESK